MRILTTEGVLEGTEDTVGTAEPVGEVVGASNTGIPRSNS